MKRNCDNYVKSIGQRDEDGNLDVEFKFFSSKNEREVSRARTWCESEAMMSRRVSVYKRVGGLNGRYVVPEIGDWNSN